MPNRHPPEEGGQSRQSEPRGAACRVGTSAAFHWGSKSKLCPPVTGGKRRKVPIVPAASSWRVIGPLPKEFFTMQVIIRRFAAIAVLEVTTLCAACRENPAGATSAPSGARLDGGVTFGSGGRSGPLVPQNTTVAVDSVSTATNRGGVTFGSGG